MTEQYVLGLHQVDREQVAVVGGKGANLGALSRLDGVRVPAGFCVTTAAFRHVLAQAPAIDDLIDRLRGVDPDDRAAVRVLSADIRRAVEGIAVPDDVAAAITGGLARLGDQDPYAVRSSATAEDLPTASFAGQQDTWLNVVGPAAVLRHVSRCWASLFTERAVAYRQRNGIDHRRVRMAVVVQRMVFPQVAGVLFTADPVTGNRRVASVEASFGLGEALVSGQVNPDVYKVRDGAVVARTVAAKQRAVLARPGGGTRLVAVEPQRQGRPALTDAQVVRLVELGRRIEAYFGHPQDIEWCLVDGDVRIVQARPVTTLFPVPVAGDAGDRVYVSVGHQQMMTDAMKPLGLSLFQLTAAAPMYEAGGRLFVDVTPRLAEPGSRAALLELMGRSDPLTEDALRTVLDRDDAVPARADAAPAGLPDLGAADPVETDPAVVPELIRRTEASLAAVERDIRSVSGPALFDFIRADVEELKRVLFDASSMRAVMAGMQAVWWLNDHVYEWLGERNAADPLIQSVPHDVTARMGLDLLDVADAIRPYPEVVAFLERAGTDEFPGGLDRLAGGRRARAAIEGWLDRYGMRCAGEIDITRPRWSEQPAALVPMILTNVRNFAPGESRRRFERGEQEAGRKEQELLERLRSRPGGEQKAQETKRMIDRARTFIGYREYPKYGMIRRYFVYKRALLAQAERLVRDGVLAERDDAFHLTFAEFHDAVRTNHVDPRLIRERAAALHAYRALTPPRVLTSDGEALSGAYRRDDVPAGALTGLGVSTGTVEGRARVIVDLARADPQPGDILVTAYTDPSWTPLFVAVAGLVTEVGGLMTHGAVVAREYGLPAVVGVPDATRLIRDGQRVRVHGAEGYVEILS